MFTKCETANKAPLKNTKKDGCANSGSTILQMIALNTIYTQIGT